MTDHERISRLEIQMQSLQNAFLQSQRNAVPQTAKVDDTASKVVELTPYTESKTAYIGDTSVIFLDVPEGNLSVYVKDIDGNYPNYTVERSAEGVAVYFEALENVTEVTISIIGG